MIDVSFVSKKKPYYIKPSDRYNVYFYFFLHFSSHKVDGKGHNKMQCEL